MFPIAYAYPKAKRAVRDLLRRRLFFVRNNERGQRWHDKLVQRYGKAKAMGNTAELLKNENYMRIRPPLILSVPNAVTS